MDLLREIVYLFTETVDLLFKRVVLLNPPVYRLGVLHNSPAKQLNPSCMVMGFRSSTLTTQRHDLLHESLFQLIDIIMAVYLVR